MSHKTRKLAGLVASVAVGIGLLGSGTYAAFTDSATATDNIKVGQQAIKITAATTNGGVAVPAGSIAADGKSVTFNAADIQGSAAGTAELNFTVTNTGTMPTTLMGVSAAPAFLGSGAFSDKLAAGELTTQYQLAPGQSHTYSGGIQWTTLQSADQGKSSRSFTRSTLSPNLPHAIPLGAGVRLWHPEEGKSNVL